MKFTAWEIVVTVVVALLWLATIALIVTLIVLVIRALCKYLRSGEVRKEKAVLRKSLGEALRAHRTRCRMTQEFVADALGVSRQAVSKWETGEADPSTANLIAIAKLYGVSAEELLKEVE